MPFSINRGILSRVPVSEYGYSARPSPKLGGSDYLVERLHEHLKLVLVVNPRAASNGAHNGHILVILHNVLQGLPVLFHLVESVRKKKERRGRGRKERRKKERKKERRRRKEKKPKKNLKKEKRRKKREERTLKRESTGDEKKEERWP